MSNTVINTINAAPLDIKTYAGSIIGDQGLQIIITDLQGNPINPTGPMKMEVRQSSKSAVLLTFGNNDGLTLAGNIITLYKQVDLPGGTYLYDLIQLNADGSIKPYFFGNFIVVQNITNPRG